MIEIPVELGTRTYPVVIGHGVAASLHELIGRFRGRRFAVVSNQRVSSLHGAKVDLSLKKLGAVARLLIPDGERYKTLDTVALIHDGLLAAGLGRDAVVVAFGGGVVGDVAGFAAATYMRGIDWVQVPTTLLAMVDSSIGGKVGVNHPKAKNLIGAFHQPRAVVADPSLLDTLPPRELRSGAYEILKCGVIADRALVKSLQGAPAGLKGWDRAELENAVASACRIKAEVVEKDEREGNLRRVLNLGHTLGHALETVTRYRRFTHGEAVGWGLVGAAWIAARKGLLRESAFDAIAAAVDHLGPRPRISDLLPDKILSALAGDKKVRDGRLIFVLPTALGRVEIRSDVKTAEIRHALKVMASREARMG
jgi:3-dehydroquinate synthase